MTFTEAFIAGVTALIIGVDIYFAAKGDTTITAWMRTKAGRHPSLPLAWGYLMGHFFGGW